MDTINFVICPERLREIPQHFSWLDHKLVKNRALKRCSAEASCLYLFLVCVGDKLGMSYYSDKAIKLQVNVENLEKARKELFAADLLAYTRPFYQVLSLEIPPIYPTKRLLITDKSNPEYIPTKEERQIILAGRSII